MLQIIDLDSPRGDEGAGCSGLHLKNLKKRKRASSDAEDDSDVEQIQNKEYNFIIQMQGCDYDIPPTEEIFEPTINDCKGKRPKVKFMTAPRAVFGHYFERKRFYLTLGNCLLPNITRFALPWMTTPFVRNELEFLIRLGSGKINYDMMTISPRLRRTSCVISNGPCITPIYVLALSAGLKIIPHRWIKDCTLRRYRQPFEELPAGWSLEYNRYINMHERRTRTPLRDLVIAIAHSKDRHFYHFWSRVCTNAGGATFQFDGFLDSMHIILAEEKYNHPSIKTAMFIGTPVVTTMWIIQSLIHGEPRNLYAHPDYAHQFEE